MIGLDTSFLIAWAIPEHPDHITCRQLSSEAASNGRTFGLTLGILAEFLHVATDPKRFSKPLTMADAIHLADFWAQAAEVALLPQATDTCHQWLHWMHEHHLGRKRVLDTLIAATWQSAGITDIFTLNPSDFTLFGQFNAYPAVNKKVG
jgi:predicted nucleic acid-binding protein